MQASSAPGELAAGMPSPSAGQEAELPATSQAPKLRGTYSEGLLVLGRREE